MQVKILTIVASLGLINLSIQAASSKQTKSPDRRSLSQEPVSRSHFGLATRGMCMSRQGMVVASPVLGAAHVQSDSSKSPASVISSDESFAGARVDNLDDRHSQYCMVPVSKLEQLGRDVNTIAGLFDGSGVTVDHARVQSPMSRLRNLARIIRSQEAQSSDSGSGSDSMPSPFAGRPRVGQEELFDNNVTSAGVCVDMGVPVTDFSNQSNTDYVSIGTPVAAPVTVASAYQVGLLAQVSTLVIGFAGGAFSSSELGKRTARAVGGKLASFWARKKN